MRMADRNLMEKAALLEWFNEDLREGVRQPCRRCEGMAIEQQAQLPHLLLLLGRPFQKGGDCMDGRRESCGGSYFRCDLDERVSLAQLSYVQ